MTNYHLFDFLGFPEDLQTDMSLWKAYPPTDVEAAGGDIIVTVPLQRQRLSKEMAADEGAEQTFCKVVLRQYNERILRLYCELAAPLVPPFRGEAPADKGNPQSPSPKGEGWGGADSSPMLLFSDNIRKLPLSAAKTEHGWLITTAEGTTRAFINTSQPPIDRWSSLQPDPQPTLDIRLFPDGRHEVRLAAYDHFSPPRYDALPLAFVEAPPHPSPLGEGDLGLPESTGTSPLRGGMRGVSLSFTCEHDERFCGTGERFFKMDLSGQRLMLKNQDGQGVNNRRTYKNIPFYISSKMYGAFFHTSAYSTLDLACHSTRSVQFLANEPKIDVFLIGGDTIGDITQGYRDLTGYPQMPPLWSFGVWMSRMTYFSADEVNDICDRLRREQYPCDVIHLDTGWFETDWLCEWKFNKERFPDPEGFVRGLLDKGFKTSLWQLPYVAEGAEQIAEARENEYIAPRKTAKNDGDGGGAESNFSSLDYAGTIDFTCPAATEWYKGLLKRLLDMGVRCIKTDFGEDIHMDADYKNLPAEQLNNLYALLYQKAAYDITAATYPERRDKDGVLRDAGIVWARAAWAGCQRFPLHWGGDSCSSYDGMAGSLKGGLHFGLSGFAFWSHDVPGFHTLPNFMNGVVRDDIYVRWTQFGVFSSHIRYHGTNKREPWRYPLVADIVKRWWKLRYRLIPYIIKESEKACRGGKPLLQALIFHHPEDKICWHTDDQYYFGDDMLVAPVMDASNRRDIYLPEGEWVELFSGKAFHGETWIKSLHVPLEYMPVFVRKGAVLPIYPDSVASTDDMDFAKVQNITIDESFRGIEL